MMKFEELIPGLELIDGCVIITDDTDNVIYKKGLPNNNNYSTKNIQVIFNNEITTIKITIFTPTNEYMELAEMLKSLLSYERHIFVICDTNNNVLFSNRENILKIEESIKNKYGSLISDNCVFEWQGCWYRLEKRSIRPSNNLYSVRVYRDVTETYRTRKESETDFLTKLYNKKGLLKRLDIFKKRKEQFAIIFADIDFFKNVNDKIGHIEADIILSKIGEILKQNIRSVDVASRFGGEEFVLVLSDCNNIEAFQRAENIRKKIASFDFKVNFPITMSFGIDICSLEKPISVAKENADKALYISKKNGRNMVTLYEDSVG